MVKIAIHSVGMANYLLENKMLMVNMASNKKDKIGLVFYFEATEQLKYLMGTYSKKR